MSLRDGMRNRKASPPSTTSAKIKLFAFSIFGKRMLFQNPTLCMPTLKPLQSREGPFSLRLTDVESVLPDPYFHTVLYSTNYQEVVVKSLTKGKSPSRRNSSWFYTENTEKKRREGWVRGKGRLMLTQKKGKVRKATRITRMS